MHGMYYQQSRILSQVGGSLSVLPLSGLSHGHVDALQPLLGMLLILGLQHVRLTVGEDLEGPGQAAITPLLGHHLCGQKKQKRLALKHPSSSFAFTSIFLTY